VHMDAHKTNAHTHTQSQSSLAQLGIPLTDVLKVLAAVLFLGNVLFYEAKNQELSMQGAEGKVHLLHHTVCVFSAYSELVEYSCLSLSIRAACRWESPWCPAPPPPEGTNAQDIPLWEGTARLLSLFCSCSEWCVLHSQSQQLQ